MSALVELPFPRGVARRKEEGLNSRSHDSCVVTESLLLIDSHGRESRQSSVDVWERNERESAHRARSLSSISVFVVDSLAPSLVKD